MRGLPAASSRPDPVLREATADPYHERKGKARFSCWCRCPLPDFANFLSGAGKPQTARGLSDKFDLPWGGGYFTGVSDEEASKFDALLNTSTPLAPRSRDEALERLAAVSETAEPSPSIMPADDETPEKAGVALIGGEEEGAKESLPRWSGEPEPNDELAELLRRMAAPREASARFLRELEERRAVLARERVTAEAGGVAVTMDGTGRLISMDIAESLYKGPHLRVVGERVVEAVERARTKVLEAAMGRTT